MPRIYLSPSTQEYNPYITGTGSEEYYMNLIADAMEPYLRANAIRWTRNSPDMTAASSIALAAKSTYDFYLALHSNASGDGSQEGQARGIIAFYYTPSQNGKRAAEIFAANLKRIYPLPQRVVTRATTALGEVRQPKPPAVLLELGYHDNTADATWIESNIELIGQNLVQSLTEYFGVPFLYPIVPRTGVVTTVNDSLNLRAYPGLSGTVIGSLPRGATVMVYAQREGWYTVWYGQQAGYASAAYIQI